MRVFLYIAGAAVELAGIILVASPDLVPQAQRASKWLGLQYARAEKRVRQFIRRPRQSTTVEVGTAGEINLAGSISAVKTTSNVGTLEQKVDFLLRRDQEAQAHVNELRERLRALEGDTEAKLSSTRSEMKQHVANALRAAHEAYLPLRIVGVVALVLGLCLVTTGNFVD